MVEYTRPAKGPNCYMPLVHAEPTVPYRQIAIVEGWGGINDSREKVLTYVRNKACETGADALLVLGGGKQKNTKLVYGITPNAGTEATSTGNVDPKPDAYLNEMERVPVIGERGHPGTYVDTVAIVYLKQHKHPH